MLGRKGLYLSGALKIIGNSGAAASTILQTLNHVTSGTATMGEVAMGVALTLFFLSSIIYTIPIDAVPAKEAYTEKEEKQIRQRDTIIKSGTAIDAVASISYLIAGLALHNIPLAIASALYFTSACIRGTIKQGEEVEKPVLDKDAPFLARIKADANYRKEYLKNNPNALAESIGAPGLVASCYGLYQVLPKEQAVAVSIVLFTAMACRFYSKALHKNIKPSRTPSEPPTRQIKPGL